METFVYKITRLDDLEYIGITVNLQSRIRDHEKSDRFKIGIKKVVVLAKTDTYEHAEYLEEDYIKHFDTYKNGLNLTPAGKGLNEKCKFNTLGWVPTIETRKKMSQNHADISGEKHPMYGKKHSQKSKDLMSSTRKGIRYKPLQVSKEVVTAILELYKEKPFIEAAGTIRGNGKLLPYDTAFAKKYAKQFGVSDAWICYLLKRTMLSWNPLVEKILDIKS